MRTVQQVALLAQEMTGGGGVCEWGGAKPKTQKPAGVWRNR